VSEIATVQAQIDSLGMVVIEQAVELKPRRQNRARFGRADPRAVTELSEQAPFDVDAVTVYVFWAEGRASLVLELG
jgi:hypothetical protein